MLIDRHLTQEEIAIYADAVIANNTEDIPSEWKNHVKDCHACSEEILAVVDILNDDDLEDYVIEQDNNVEPKVIFFKKKYFSVIAASVVLFFSIGMIYYHFAYHIQPSHKQLSDVFTDTTVFKSTEIDKEDIVNNDLLAFSDNDDFEQLVNRFSEKSLRGFFSVKTDSFISIKKDDELVLNWENADNDLLFVEIFNNKGNKIYEEECTGDSIKIENLLKEGVFYWKILDEDFELLFCGKIIVK